MGSAEPEEWWSMDKVDTFYRECCLGCEEEPDPAISAAFKVVFFHSRLSTHILSRPSTHRQQIREPWICLEYS